MTSSRLVLIVSHTARDTALAATGEACLQLQQRGITPVISSADLSELRTEFSSNSQVLDALNRVVELEELDDLSVLEIVIVLGGDGTILKAAEIVREAATPILGVNLGHVGFLAESEREELSVVITSVAEKTYSVEERLTLEVSIEVSGEIVYRTWALNEAAVEKMARERMLEVLVEVDQRPLSSFGCDGIVIATPTGSTAYAFSAGGPVVWPNVEALLVVPLSAHALFARPLVVGTESRVAVQLLARSQGHGVLWCDGRRTTEIPPGARIEAVRSTKPVRLARINDAPFTDRLVRKFSLPVEGWRGTTRGQN